MPPSPPPRRLSLLPPELEDIDAGWGEEPPTVVPTRPASLPQRPPLISIAELDDDGISDRVTSIPEEPHEDFARRVMGAAGDKTIPPHSRRPTAPAPEEPSSLLEEALLDDEDLFDRPTLEGARAPRPSEYPTAPPPQSADPDRARTVPRVPRPVHQGAPAWHDVPTDPPPARATTHREPLSGLERARRAVTPLTRDFGEASAPDQDSSTAPSFDDGGLEFTGKFGSLLSPPEPLDEMKDRFAMGDFSGALALAERILTKEPDQREAKQLASKCRDVLYDMYASRIAGMDREVSVIMGPDQLRWLSLDHRAGFLLAMIDGVSTVDELLDVSGMPRLDALRILCDLLDQKVIGLGL